MVGMGSSAGGEALALEGSMVRRAWRGREHRRLGVGTTGHCLYCVLVSQ